jgi:deazaflavin-dependent oxidoreductase (nitroreductase family)
MSDNAGMAPRSTAEWQAINEKFIREFRENGGRVAQRYPLILLTTIGRRTGRPLVTPLDYSEDGESIVVIASAGGAEQHPAWYLNLAANPEVTIERGEETFEARARTAEEPERTRLYDQQVRLMPFFAMYRRQVKSREIPVVVFERLD